jgi:hypothetical protein
LRNRFDGGIGIDVTDIVSGLAKGAVMLRMTRTVLLCPRTSLGVLNRLVNLLSVLHRLVKTDMEQLVRRSVELAPNSVAVLVVELHTSLMMFRGA